MNNLKLYALIKTAVSPPQIFLQDLHKFASMQSIANAHVRISASHTKSTSSQRCCCIPCILLLLCFSHNINSKSRKHYVFIVICIFFKYLHAAIICFALCCCCWLFVNVVRIYFDTRTFVAELVVGTRKHAYKRVVRYVQNVDTHRCTPNREIYWLEFNCLAGLWELYWTHFSTANFCEL